MHITSYFSKGPVLTNILQNKTTQSPSHQQQNYYQLQQQQQQQRQQQYRKQLSQSFRDILENTLLINGMCEPPSGPPPQPQPVSTTTSNNSYHIAPSSPYIHRGGNHHQSSSAASYHASNSNVSAESSYAAAAAAINRSLSPQHQVKQQFTSPTRPPVLKPTSPVAQATNSSSQVPTTPVLVNTQLALKFAQLEQTLAITKAENNNLLEQQVILEAF